MLTQKTNRSSIRLALLLPCLFLLLPGCSIKRIAVNKLGNALAGGGDTFSGDDDPDLIRDALPFSLKLMESLLAESPRHKGLLLAAASGFTPYAYAFLQEEADEVEDREFARATALRKRARNMYLRARDYGLRGLDVSLPGFSDAVRRNPLTAVARARVQDVPLLYWTAASWGAAISLSKDNPDLVADQAIVEALIDRALVLDERFGEGAIHAFLITYESARNGAKGDFAVRSLNHADQAVKLSRGHQAGPWVSVAEVVCVAKQERKCFEDALNKALSVDVNAAPSSRMVNLVMQRRARWLLSKADDLFVDEQK